MKTFSRLNLLTLLFLGFTLMLVGETVHAQQEQLEVYTAGGQAEYNIGDPVSVTFIVTLPKAVTLEITASGVSISSPGPPGSYTTAADTGALTVTGTITSSGAYIQAVWAKKGLTLRVDFCCPPITTPPATIVVNPPNPKSPLAVGDTFTQTISVENQSTPFQTALLSLSAWQMDIVYDPLILEVVSVTEGDFLEQAGEYALDEYAFDFLEQAGEYDLTFVDSEQRPDREEALLFVDSAHIPGRISIKQVRTDGNGVPLFTSGSGVLVTLRFRFVSSSETLVGLQNVRLSDPSGERLSYSVTLTPVVATHASAAAEDVNQDGNVDILDLVVVANSIGAARPNLRADVNDDDIIDVLDLVAIVGSPRWGRSVGMLQVREPNADAPAAPVKNLSPETVREWITLAQLKNDGSLLFQNGIANLKKLLAAKPPAETLLLSNYPNPFNPETWIPYQLSEPANVTVSIYSINGHPVRTLTLGHQPAGLYQHKSRAAYWDGRNEFGEPVASGLYFYTLTAGDFTATRKMLIRK